MVLQSIGNWWLNLIGVRRDDSNAYKDKPKSDPNPRTTAPIPPGRVSVSNDTTDMLSVLKGEADFLLFVQKSSHLSEVFIKLTQM